MLFQVYSKLIIKFHRDSVFFARQGTKLSGNILNINLFVFSDPFQHRAAIATAVSSDDDTVRRRTSVSERGQRRAPVPHAAAAASAA